MKSVILHSRIAGILYLVVILSGFYSLAYIPSNLIDRQDMNATFQNISDSQLLFRSGIAVSIICYLAFLFLPFALYRIFDTVDKAYARWMVIFVTASIPVAFVNLQHPINVVALTEKNNYLQNVDLQELKNIMMLQLQAYDSGLMILEIFWGLWLLPLGYLIFKSAMLPKLLGVLLMLGCLGYLLDVFGSLLISNFHSYSLSTYITLPAAFGEIGTGLWLLIAGVKNRA